jgi:type I restriction enzyme S subunit
MTREMKDSGIEWIGEIPAAWGVYPARFAFSELRTKNIDGIITNALKFFNGTIIPKINFDADSDDYVAETIINYTIVEPDTIMINGLNLNYDLKSLRVGLVKERGIITSAYLALKPDRNRILPEYATYLFKGYEAKMAFHNMGAGIRKTLGFKEFKRQPILLPSVLEQQAIADFLDTECARIDAVIEKTRASIEEYKKLKQAIITQAVTKGIRPNRVMKNSGIEWIGGIPEDWMIRKGKWILTKLERPVCDTDGVITCFRDGEVTLRSKRREEGFTFSLQEVGYQGIDIDDLVVHGMDGFAGAIGISDSRGKGTPVLNVLDSSQNKRYLMYYLRSMAYNGVFLALATGIRVRSCDTNWNKLKELPYPVPSLQEQKAIADFIDEHIEKIDNLITRKTTFLAELESYKKSLIFEYVTGKKEVASAPIC